MSDLPLHVPDPLPIQFIHEARNCLVPARFHVDRLIETCADRSSEEYGHLTAVRRGIVGALEFAELVAKWADAGGADA